MRAGKHSSEFQDVIDFIEINVDFFLAPFEDQKSFADWARSNPALQEITSIFTQLLYQIFDMEVDFNHRAYYDALLKLKAGDASVLAELFASIKPSNENWSSVCLANTELEPEFRFKVEDGFAAFLNGVLITLIFPVVRAWYYADSDAGAGVVFQATSSQYSRAQKRREHLFSGIVAVECKKRSVYLKEETRRLIRENNVSYLNDIRLLVETYLRHLILTIDKESGGLVKIGRHEIEFDKNRDDEATAHIKKKNFLVLFQKYALVLNLRDAILARPEADLEEKDNLEEVRKNFQSLFNARAYKNILIRKRSRKSLCCFKSDGSKFVRKVEKLMPSWQVM